MRPLLRKHVLKSKVQKEKKKTKDYVRETLAIRQEETDEMGFVPSASSEPREAHCWCDNRCSDKARRYMQIDSMVIEEGGEARTIKLCKLCCNAKLVQQGKQPLKSKERKEVLEKKAHRDRPWKVFGSEQFLRRMWEYFTLKRTGARKILAVQKKCGYRLRCPNDASCVQCEEVERWGKVQRRMQEGRKAQ